MATKPSKFEKKLLHYTGKAIADFNMISKGDRVLVCVSGGKDSLTLLKILRILQVKTRCKFSMAGIVIDQGLPGWNDQLLEEWLQSQSVPFEILRKDTYSIVKDKIPEGDNYCSFCARLRRGIIYKYAETHGFNKIALGHHRDDLIASLLMSILYSGNISSMPPKLLTKNKKLITIRPFVYCQEKDILAYSLEQVFPLIPRDICIHHENTTRKKVRQLIDRLAEDNPKVPSNILHALQCVKPSQLMDSNLWDFIHLQIEKDE